MTIRKRMLPAFADPTTRAEKDTQKYSGGTEVGQKTPGRPPA